MRIGKLPTVSATSPTVLAMFLALVMADCRGGEPAARGASHPGLEIFDRLMQSCLKEQEVPGGALAIARRGRLVYARGFGEADRETGEPVRPDSLFRIASLSKPITAAAVLLLVDQGILRLDDKAVDLLGIDPGRVPGGVIPPRWRRVTVRHLLQHNSGWDAPRRDRDAVPIAKRLGIDPPAPSSDVVRWMLGQPLDAEPGTRHVYANLGYEMLGRVIEAVAGMPYDEFVRLRLLAPLGVDDMRIAPNTARDRLPREVRYHDSKGRSGRPEFARGAGGCPAPLPYTLQMDNLDAFGGWAASAVDLVRFASAFRRDAPQPLLSPASFQAMLAPPEGKVGHHADGRPRSVFYGCGWMVAPVGNGGEPYLWHNGNLPGTSTLLVHRHRDGFDFAALFNRDHGPKGKRPADEVEHAINVAIDSIADDAWPAVEPVPARRPSAAPGDDAGETEGRGGESVGNRPRIRR